MMIRRPIDFRPALPLVLLLAVALGSCSTAPLATERAPAVRGAERAGPLQPSPGALRTAERVTLTGLELGTMWTFENPPLDYWRRTYGFEATQEWLDEVRLASVRYGNVCSASFVSPNGLVMTNHHCACGCIEAVSTQENDYLLEGFHARDRGSEAVCPNLFLDQLVDVDDVTR